MTAIARAARIGDNSVDFQNDMSIKEKEGTQPFIKACLFISDNENKIQLVSCIIDTRKVIRSFIESDKDIGGFASLNETVIAIRNLSLNADEPMCLLVQKPLKASQELFLYCDNSSDIIFEDCNEYTPGDVFDRLIYATNNLFDYYEGNIVLDNIKSLIFETNAMFQAVDVVRLLGYKPSAFIKYGVLKLNDICKLDFWDIGVSVAKGLYVEIDTQLKALVIPSIAIESLFADLKERERYIVENRYFKSNKTLEELGAELGLTRERVRQILLKVKRKFHSSRSRVNLIKAIFHSLSVLCDCDCCFTLSELDKHAVSENGLVFLLDVLGNKRFLIHIPGTECIAYADQDGKCYWLEQIDNVTKSIPVVLLEDEQKSIAKSISSLLIELGFEIPESIITVVAFREYEKNGSTYVKRSVRMGDRYEIVLEKFFPNGIRLSQVSDMELFRKGYAALFEDDKISDTDHAVAVRIADRCMLIDRGTYIPNRKTELPTELYQRILEYIIQYPFDMVMTNAIMHKFDSELKAIGVDNKYYLLSVLKLYFADKFSFKRDYIIKGENAGNFYNNIISFVESYPEGVSFHDIQMRFQGIPDTMLSFALSEDDGIISMYKRMYIHRNNITFHEQQEVLSYLLGVISQERIVSDERVFRLMKRDHPDFIANNNIYNSWFLFSVLRSFFSDQFNFSRPHIIDLALDSANAREVLRSSFWGKKYVEIADIKSYAKEKHIQIYDMSKLLNSYCDRYFILNKERLISIEEIGYKQDEFAHIEDVVIDALGDLEYAEIAKLNIVNAMPRASVTITEWLIYSIINKYGTRSTAVTSTPYFMNSVPLVVRNGADIETIREDFASLGRTTQTVRIDDLSDIDSLVEEIIDIDSMGGW